MRLGPSTSLSPELAAHVERVLGELGDPARAALAAAPPVVSESVTHVFAASDFVAHACVRDAELLPQLIESGDLERALPGADYGPRAPQLDVAAGVAEARMRRWRRRELTRIAWRDLAGWASLTETLAELSAFADQAIVAAVGAAESSLRTRYGEPRGTDGAVQPLVVIGMGKLGGGELNFSSDVDLVLLFPEHGETDGPLRISNEEFFTRLGQAMVRLLQSPTPEGFVLRVDLRLRPFGDSGPLVSSFAAFEDYLPRHGRDWPGLDVGVTLPVTAVPR